MMTNTLSPPLYWRTPAARAAILLATLACLLLFAGASAASLISQGSVEIQRTEYSPSSTFRLQLAEATQNGRSGSAGVRP